MKKASEDVFLNVRMKGKQQIPLGVTQIEGIVEDILMRKYQGLVTLSINEKEGKSEAPFPFRGGSLELCSLQAVLTNRRVKYVHTSSPGVYRDNEFICYDSYGQNRTTVDFNLEILDGPLKGKKYEERHEYVDGTDVMHIPDQWICCAQW